MDKSKPFFANLSVIICTYKRLEQFTHALNSLINQNLPISEFEIIVVDNNPVQNPTIKNLVENYRDSIFFSHPQNIQYLPCKLIGLSYARNLGINQSHGDIICFIDDDAIAPPDWLKTIKKAFKNNPQAGVIGGHIFLNIPEPRPKILEYSYEVFWSQFITLFSEYTEVDSWDKFPWGANWCVRREAILAVGCFNKNYGRGSFGRKYWCGEELIAAQQIQNLGYKIAIEPKSTVIHEVDRSRFTLGHLWNVILSDKLVRYQAQKDGLLPKNNPEVQPRPPRTIWNKLYNFFLSVQEFIHRNTHPILLFYQVFAHVIIFSLKIFDFFSDKARQ